MAVERHDGTTPNGGVRSEGLYTDDQGRPCAKEKASHIEIVEYDAEGNAIRRTHLHKRPSP